MRESERHVKNSAVQLMNDIYITNQPRLLLWVKSAVCEGKQNWIAFRMWIHLTLYKREECRSSWVMSHGWKSLQNEEKRTLESFPFDAVDMKLKTFTLSFLMNKLTLKIALLSDSGVENRVKIERDDDNMRRLFMHYKHHEIVLKMQCCAPVYCLSSSFVIQNSEFTQP